MRNLWVRGAAKTAIKISLDFSLKLTYVNYISGQACLISSCYPLGLPPPVPRCAFEKRAAALQLDAYRALIGRRCCGKSCRFRHRLPAHYSPSPTPTWPGQWGTVLRSYFSFLFYHYWYCWWWEPFCSQSFLKFVRLTFVIFCFRSPLTFEGFN